MKKLTIILTVISIISSAISSIAAFVLKNYSESIGWMCSSMWALSSLFFIIMYYGKEASSK